MARRVGDKDKAPAGAGGDRAPAQSPLVLAGIALLLVLGGWSLAEVRSVRKELTDKMAGLDTKVAALQAKVEAGAKAAQPRRSGPDPDKAYTIRTDGSPAKGEPGAAVTIAEFSDFQ